MITTDTPRIMRAFLLCWIDLSVDVARRRSRELVKQDQIPESGRHTGLVGALFQTISSDPEPDSGEPIVA
jgi:hypothetical protein